MPLSTKRQATPADAAELAVEPLGDAKPYEVFIQLRPGDAFEHAGTVDAPNDALAFEFARRHYARDQACVDIWVVPREAIIRKRSDDELVYPLSDQDYRRAKGYSADVARKWRQVREEQAVRAYEQDDLKEAFE